MANSEALQHGIKVKNNKLKISYLYILGLLLFTHSFLFTYQNSIPLIKSDGWRFIQLYLIPWFNGELSLRLLWSDFHPQPLTALLFILNAEFFDLRMDIEGGLAVTFSLFLFVALLNSIKRTVIDNLYSTSDYISIVAVGFFIFSFTSTAIYTWSLVTLGYIFMFFGVVVVVLVDKCISSGVKGKKLFLLILPFFLFLILFGHAGKIFIYSLLIVTLFNLFLKRKTDWIYLSLSLIGAVLLQELFIHLLRVEEQYSITKSLSFSLVLTHLADYIRYVGIGLLSAWVDLNIATKKFNLSPALISGIGIFLLITYLWALFCYFRSGLSYRSVLPGTMVLVSLITGLSASVFRFNPAKHSVMAAGTPRYYLLYMVGAIGVVWIFSYCLKSVNRKMAGNITAIFIIPFVILQCYSAFNAWKLSPFIKKGIMNSYNIMLEHSNGNLSKKLPRYMVGGNYPEPYLEGLSFLKDNELNLFSQSKIVDKYKR